MNILDQIVLHKKKEIQDRKSAFPLKHLEKSVYFNAPSVSMKSALLQKDRAGIIAEFKRKSPSKGILNRDVAVEETTAGYARAGASALSVLTDTEFFGGSTDDLAAARRMNPAIPILRKDFTVDEYQIVEAKSIGADVILLLANVLSPREIRQFAGTARSLGLEVLLEVREKAELDSLCADVQCVGVNNRNLKDFKVNVDQSFELAEFIPADFVRISESGIASADTIHELRKAGYRGFLIGETFMKTPKPAEACLKLIQEVLAAINATGRSSVR